MFYVYLFVLVFGYTINNVGYVNLSRKYDGISLSLYRGVFISLVLFPLLFIADYSNFSYEVLFYFLLIGLVGGIGMVFQLESYKYLPAGIVSSLMNLNVIGVLILGYIYYSEQLSFYGYIGGSLVLFSSIALGFFKNNFKHLKPNYLFGLFLVSLRILTLSIWVFGIAYFAREVDVYISSFLGESMVIFPLLLLTLYNKQKKGYYIKKISFKEFRYLFFISIFPALGTLAIVLAVSIGSLPIVSITMASISIFTAIASYFLFKEKLFFTQWLLIIITMIGLVIMNIE